MRNYFMRTIFLIVLLALASFAFATVVNVGTGNTAQRHPITNYWHYESSAALYKNSEIGGSGTITEISYMPHASNAQVVPFKVYLKATTASVMTAVTWSAMTTGATLVYTSAGFATTADVAVNLNVDDYVLPAGSNLLVIFENYYAIDDPGTSTGSSFWGTTSMSGYMQYWYASTANVPIPGTATGSLTSTTNRPNVTLNITDYVPIPQPLPAVAVYPLAGATGIGPLPTFSWTAGAGNPPTGYRLFFGTDAAATNIVNDMDAGLVTEYTAPAPLTVGTTYYWKVVPYNDEGLAADCPVWSFSTSSAVTAIASLIMPTPTAVTGVSINAGLQWASVTNATSYDVYFATTAAGLPGTPNANVTTRFWVPPTMAPLTAYSWKIVPRNAFAATTGTPAVWTFTTGADPTFTLSPTTPYLQNFDLTTFPPAGWANYKWDNVTTATGLWDRSTTQYKTVASARFNSSSYAVNTEGVLVSPPINIPADGYRVSFWDYRSTTTSTVNEKVGVYCNTVPSITGATLLYEVPRYTALAPIVPAAGWYKYTANFPAGFAGNARYIIFKGTSNYNTFQYIDDIAFEIDPLIPNPAILVAPTMAATGQIAMPALTWTAPVTGPIPTSYKLYLGTTTPPTNLIDGVNIGDVLTYTPATNLAANTLHYWRIVPVTETGAAVLADCPIWTFTTQAVLTAVSATPTPANNATAVSPYAAISWTSVSGASSYDVYFATVAEGMPATPTANVTTTSWMPPVRTYDTAYTWKVVGRNSYGASSGTPNIWTYTTWADPTISVLPYTQAFPTTGLPVGFVSTPLVGTSNWNTSTTNHSTPNSAYVYLSGGNTTLLSTPPIVIPADDYRVTFWMNRSSSTTIPNDRIELYLGTDYSSIATATLLGTYYNSYTLAPVETTSGWKQYVMNFGAGSAGTKRLLFDAIGAGGSSFYIDDITVEQIPSVPDMPTLVTPANAATLIGPAQTLTWTAATTGAAATSFKIYFGTDAAATNLVNGTDIGLNLTYDTTLLAGTTYYWTVAAVNANGTGPAAAIRSFTTRSAVSAIATLTSPAPTGAVDVAKLPTLQWGSVTNAQEYDVYFGFVLPETPNATVTTTSWATPELLYGGNYSWKIVPKNVFGITTGTPEVWTFTVMADPLVTSFPYIYGFNDATYPASWTNFQTAPVGSTTAIWKLISLGVHPAGVLPHAGTGMGWFNSYSSPYTSGVKAALVSPPLQIPNDNYRVSYWMYRDNSNYITDVYATEGITAYLNTTATVGGDTLGYIPRATNFAPVVEAPGWYMYSYTLGAGSAGTKYVALEAKSCYGNDIYIDDFLVAEIPSIVDTAIVVGPTMGAINQWVTTSLRWAANPNGAAPTGYWLYLGTDNPPTDIYFEKEVETATSWLPEETLAFNTRYYWQVRPYNTLGELVENCPVWSFTTMPDPTIRTFPYTEGFENPALPLAWLSKKVAGTGALSWKAYTSTSTTYIHSGAYSAQCPDQTAGTTWQLVSAPIEVPTDNYQVMFWMYRQASSTSYPNELLNVYLSDNETTLGLTPLMNGTIHNYSNYTPTETAAGWYSYAANFGTGSTGDAKRLIFEAVMTYGTSIYIDDVTIREIPVTPAPAFLVSPATNSTDVPLTATLNWIADRTGPAPTGYRLFFGTDNPPTNVVYDSDLGLVTTYTPALAYDSLYFWQVVPYNAEGDAVNCPVWQFEAMPDPTWDTFPAIETFSNILFPPNGWTTLHEGATGTGTNVFGRSTSYNHTPGGSGTAYASTSYVNANITLYTPDINLPADNYRVNFWMYRYTGTSYPNDGLQVYFNTTNSLTGATLLGFIPRYMAAAAPIEAGSTSAMFNYKFNLPAGSAGDGRYIIFKTQNTEYAYDYIYLDDIKVEEQPITPESAVAVYPLHTGTQVGPTPTLSWTANPIGNAPTGYKLKYGTTATLDGPTQETINVNEATTYVIPTPLTINTTYYWQVIPYNANGDCADAPIWSFATSPAITAVAGTPAPANNATGVSAYNSLGWATVTNATMYDVYFGTTMPTEVTATVTTNSWTPPVMAYNTTYTWKVVPKNGFVSTTGTPVVWTFTTLATDPTIILSPTTTYTQNFDATTFPPDGYLTMKTAGTSTGTWARSTTQNYPATGTGLGSAMFNSSSYSDGTEGILATPPISVPGTEQYQLGIWFYHSSSDATYPDLVEVYLSDNSNLTGATLLRSISRYRATAGWQKYEMDLPLGTAGTKFVVLKGHSAYGTYMYVDDLTLKLRPLTPPTAIIGAPLNAATLVAPTPTLSWSAGIGNPTTGYNVLMGTVNPPVDIVYTGADTSYSVSTMLLPGTVYYWQVIPSNTHGSTPAVECPVWSFTVAPQITVAITEILPQNATVTAGDIVTLAWNSVANATNFDLYFGTEQPLTMVANIAVTPTTTIWNVPSVTRGTTYFWRVVPKNLYGESIAECPVWSFTTMTDPTISAYPYTADFESTSFPPAGWNAWLWALATTNHSGSYSAGAKYIPAGTKILTTAPFAIPEINPLDPPTMKFWWRNTDPAWYSAVRNDLNRTATHDTTYYEVSTDNGSTWTTLSFLSPVSSQSAHVEHIQDLSAYANQTVIFRWRYSTNGSSSAYGISVDDVVVTVPPATLPPVTDLVISENLGDIVLAWQHEGGATSYKVYGSTDPIAIDWTLLGTASTMTYTHVAAAGTFNFYKVVASTDPMAAAISTPAVPVSKPINNRRNVIKPGRAKK